jgi:hypothetical protein
MTTKSSQTKVSAYPRMVALVALLVLASFVAPVGAAEPDAFVAPVPTSLRFTSEILTLPGHEKMGMLGGTMLFDVSPRMRLGLGSYGAVRGERGGFITLGAAGEVHQPLADAWSARASVFVGAGGGRGGYTLSGGGLMLRTDAGLVYETKSIGNFGFGASHVSFPSGTIGSSQAYLQYDYPYHTLLSPGWSMSEDRLAIGTSSTGLKANANELDVVHRSYQLPDAVVRDDGSFQHKRMQLVGIEWLSYLNDRWFLKLESEGAMGGQSNGYMQILAGGGYRVPLSSSKSLKLYAAAGPAGGGGVDTGGGLLLDSGISFKQSLNNKLSLELGLSELRAPSRSFRAQSMDLKLGYQFGTPAVSDTPVTWSDLNAFDASCLRVRLANQTYYKAAPQWRNRLVDTPVENLGAQLDYFVSPHTFVTGQGLAAYRGDAGAYMTGQIGIGLQQSLSQFWSVEAEVLAGAAGGGGLAVGSGLVMQGNGSLRYRLSDTTSLMATAGRIQSINGDFKANMVGLSVAYQFTGYTKR